MTENRTFATGSNPASVAIDDVNGDGKPDLVVTNSSDNSVSVLFIQNGYMSGGSLTDPVFHAGTDFYFGPKFTYTSPVPEPSTFALLGAGGLGLAVPAIRRRRTV